jgi:N-acetyl-anhydromuramoyl-L-alanine amidase
MTLTVHVPTGSLVGVRQVLSPHRDARPADATVDLIVMHGISLPPNDFGGPWIDRLFTGSLPADVHPYFATIRGMRVSAHVLVRRSGEIVQYVPFHQRAWHAGASQFEGRSACNDFSIGIEMEGGDDMPYEAVQYCAAGKVLRALFAAYPLLSESRIVGHSDVAPGRKTDPGPSFEWSKLRAQLHQ